MVLFLFVGYLLSKEEGQPGTPEKPLSDLGRVSYHAYWKSIVLEYLHAHRHQEIVIGDIGRDSGMYSHDIATTFQILGFIRHIPMDDGYRLGLCINWSRVDMHMKKIEGALRLNIDPECLRWTPLLIPTVNPFRSDMDVSIETAEKEIKEAVKSEEEAEEEIILPKKPIQCAAKIVLQETTLTPKIDQHSVIELTSSGRRRTRPSKYNETTFTPTPPATAANPISEPVGKRKRKDNSLATEEVPNGEVVKPAIAVAAAVVAAIEAPPSIAPTHSERVVDTPVSDMRSSRSKSLARRVSQRTSVSVENTKEKDVGKEKEVAKEKTKAKTPAKAKVSPVIQTEKKVIPEVKTVAEEIFSDSQDSSHHSEQKSIVNTKNIIPKRKRGWIRGKPRKKLKTSYDKKKQTTLTEMFKKKKVTDSKEANDTRSDLSECNDRDMESAPEDKLIDKEPVKVDVDKQRQLYLSIEDVGLKPKNSQSESTKKKKAFKRRKSGNESTEDSSAEADDEMEIDEPEYQEKSKFEKELTPEIQVPSPQECSKAVEVDKDSTGDTSKSLEDQEDECNNKTPEKVDPTEDTNKTDADTSDIVPTQSEESKEDITDSPNGDSPKSPEKTTELQALAENVIIAKSPVLITLEAKKLLLDERETIVISESEDCSNSQSEFQISKPQDSSVIVTPEKSGSYLSDKRLSSPLSQSNIAMELAKLPTFQICDSSPKKMGNIPDKETLSPAKKDGEGSIISEVIDCDAVNQSFKGPVLLENENEVSSVDDAPAPKSIESALPLDDKTDSLTLPSTCLSNEISKEVLNVDAQKNFFPPSINHQKMFPENSTPNEIPKKDEMKEQRHSDFIPDYDQVMDVCKLPGNPSTDQGNPNIRPEISLPPQNAPQVNKEYRAQTKCESVPVQASYIDNSNLSNKPPFHTEQVKTIPDNVDHRKNIVDSFQSSMRTSPEVISKFSYPPQEAQSSCIKMQTPNVSKQNFIESKGPDKSENQMGVLKISGTFHSDPAPLVNKIIPKMDVPMPITSPVVTPHINVVTEPQGGAIANNRYCVDYGQKVSTSISSCSQANDPMISHSTLANNLPVQVNRDGLHFVVNPNLLNPLAEEHKNDPQNVSKPTKSKLRDVRVSSLHNKIDKHEQKKVTKPETPVQSNCQTKSYFPEQDQVKNIPEAVPVSNIINIPTSIPTSCKGETKVHEPPKKQDFYKKEKAPPKVAEKNTSLKHDKNCPKQDQNEVNKLLPKLKYENDLVSKAEYTINQIPNYHTSHPQYQWPPHWDPTRLHGTWEQSRFLEHIQSKNPEKNPYFDKFQGFNLPHLENMPKSPQKLHHKYDQKDFHNIAAYTALSASPLYQPTGLAQHYKESKPAQIKQPECNQKTDSCKVNSRQSKNSSCQTQNDKNKVPNTNAYSKEQQQVNNNKQSNEVNNTICNNLAQNYDRQQNQMIAANIINNQCKNTLDHNQFNHNNVPHHGNTNTNQCGIPENKARGDMCEKKTSHLTCKKEDISNKDTQQQMTQKEEICQSVSPALPSLGVYTPDSTSNSVHSVQYGACELDVSQLGLESPTSIASDLASPCSMMHMHPSPQHAPHPLHASIHIPPIMTGNQPKQKNVHNRNR